MGTSILTTGYHRDADTGALHCEGVPLARVAESVGTPAFVYSTAEIRAQYERLTGVLAGVRHRIHYSVKANSCLAVLSLLRELGAGVDIVSGGELHRALLAGFSGSDIVFSGVGKTATEIRQALRAGVEFFNVESEGELRVVDAVAAAEGVTAPVALRINPEVDVSTPHRYTRTGGRGDKFGIPHDEALDVVRLAVGMRNVRLVGLDMHVGSQLTRMAPYERGVSRLLALLDDVRPLAGDTLRWLDLGGGLAVQYQGDDPAVDLEAFGAMARNAADVSGLDLVIEPGRFLVANAGVLLTRVIYRKRSGGKDFVIADAGMTELIRPSHYQAHHLVESVEQRVAGAANSDVDGDAGGLVDVVGPICESGDFLALDRALAHVVPGDLLALFSAGAYGYVMASNYNSRPRPPEVLVDGRRFGVATARESHADLTRLERTTPAWEE
ncbi:MAG: diaminopimelate decarboxylase [Gemmatimonadaceae bacterium]